MTRLPGIRLPAPLRDTLAALAGQLKDARNPWWVIGGTAAVLHGLQSETVGDVDVVLSATDARRVLSDLGIDAIADGGDGTFRSEVFARWTDLPLMVEFLGGFHIRGAPIEIATRDPVPVRDAIVYVPSRTELVRILRLFGRPQDIARAEALTRRGQRPGSSG